VEAAKILVVDDDSTMLGVVDAILNRHRYKVLPVCDPREALQIVRHGELVDREIALDLERREPAHERSRSSLRRILPEIVLGSDSTNSISRGYL